MDCGTVCERLDERLHTEAYADLDGSVNGLQVGRRDREVERVAVAVDAAAATIEAAVEWGADLLVVHHGLSWGGIDRVTGRAYDRVAPLVEDDVALYASHLPLDGHPELGNAAGIADLLGLEERSAFGALGGEHVGLSGRLPAARSLEDLAGTLREELDTGGGDVRTLAFGPEAVEVVAIVTGAGADWFDEAVAAGVDAFVTGEGKGRLYHQARESDVGVLLGGHYATETFGVRALGRLLEEWGLETTFLEHPTGL